MSNYRRSSCRACGASGNDVPISRTGLCPDCGIDRLLTTHQQLRTGTGPAYERWLNGMRNPRAPVGRPITPHTPDA